MPVLYSKTIARAQDWEIKTQKSTSGNDTNKTFTVPSGKEWALQSIRVSLVTSTSTAGDRQLTVRYESSGGDIFSESRPGASQSNSLTRKYELNPGAPDLTGFRDTDYLSTPVPPSVLSENFVVRITDKSSVSTNDDMSIFFHYMERDEPSTAD